MKQRRWVEETYGGGDDLTRIGFLGGRVRCDVTSAFQRIEIVETEAAGPVLLLDGAFMTSAKHEHYYHEMLAHVPLARASSIRRILVIGGGDGGTVREVLKYPEVERVTLCEIDGDVVAACKEHLPEMRVPWDDSRLDIVCGDGVAFVENTNDSFDAILVDGADPVGPAAALFSPEFYASCKKRLGKNGILASQTESPIGMREDFLRIVRTMRASFRCADPYFAPMPIYPGGTWSWTVAYDGPTLLERPERVKQVEPTCKYYNRQIHRAAFALPNDLLRELAIIRH